MSSAHHEGMSKPITPRTHGMIDYGSVALMLAAPSVLGLTGAARTLSYAFGGSYLLLSAFTDDPLGLKRALPFRTHGKLELASAPALLALPWLTGALKDPKARMYFLGLLGTVATVYSLTDWEADPDL
ncbi:hypothetical protein Deipe_3012 [Deinococcus peraridilitoris DSM 19664]|uniref:Uncharacterized protein n=2 Tax=Deinococcus TaxID=1298 RepID=L0A5K0_DEIPD|nr:hypothetical protein Deipe_3012 [Deinococcus peraridilitoris DSM 19664]